MEEVHYCSDPEKVSLEPGVHEALRRLKAAGFKNIVITNQSGIGRGYMTEQQYRAVEAEVLRQIGPELLDATYFCPDAPGQPSTRRKPQIGMVLEAVADHDLDLSRSFFVGDKTSDIECGRNAGIRTILVQTGHAETSDTVSPDFIAKDVVAAVDIILKNVDV